jgi:hypothetical protein
MYKRGQIAKCLNRQTILLRGFVVWLIIVLAEVLHGTARVFLLEPLVGDFKARQIGVFTGSIIIIGIAIASIRWIRAAGVFRLLSVGFLWSGLMFGFEIFLGRFVMGLSWERILSEYNLLKGGLMAIGLLVLTLSPLIAAKVRRII